MPKATLLIVEDEAAIRDMICFTLSEQDYQIIQAADAKTALSLVKQSKPDLILLDWMLPGMSGVDFIKALRKSTHGRDIRIILLTAKACEMDKVTGFEAGADDYITKPFSPRELQLRIKTVLRRGIMLGEDNTIRIDDMAINLDNQQVTICQQIINLSPNEFKLLRFFVTHRGRVYNRDQLLTLVWGEQAFLEERTVDVQVKRLRQALKPHNYADYIETVRGSGYRFKA